jgi:hypothetical protein
MLQTAAAVATVIGLMATAAAPASAAPTDKFSAQATAAGLTAAQAKQLQTKVDAYLKITGGKQTAANEILYPNGGAILLVTLPGEQNARRLGATTQEPQGCPADNLCAYKYEWWGGDSIWAYYCNYNYSVPWVTTGSWINNQSSGTRGYFVDNNWYVIYTTPPAYYPQPTGQSWLPIRAIDPC